MHHHNSMSEIKYKIEVGHSAVVEFDGNYNPITLPAFTMDRSDILFDTTLKTMDEHV